MAFLRKVLHSYLLAGPNGPITLRGRGGWRPSDRSNPNWDATHAVRTTSGYKVLLTGAASLNDKFYVWDVNSAGVITRGSGWKTAAQSTALNWEHTFSQDFDSNGLISGGSSYLLAGPNGPITLRGRGGWRPSDRSNPNWDATHAVRTTSGYKVLLTGAASLNDKFLVWDVNSAGVIMRGSGWKTAAQSTALNWEHTFSQDFDSNGLISGGSSYLLAGPNGPITLRGRGGWRPSDRNPNWDATHAVRTSTGYKVLLTGAASLNDKFLVWDVNSAGVITRGSGWKTARNALVAGWETSFGDVILRDGVIGLNDDYDDSINTDGKVEINDPEIGELEIEGDHDWFAITLTEGKRYQFDVFGITLDDPYLHLRGANGSLISSNDDGGAGRNSRLNFNPTQTGDYFLDVGAWANRGEGRYIISATELAPVDDGDASFLIRGTPEIGNTLTIARTADDPDGNGSSPTITWQRSSDGNSWATVATGSQLTLTDAFAGQQLRATVSYIDGENFSEQVFTNTVEVIEPPVDDGDASFLIRGTPEIGNTLTIARTADDPDGNGSSPTITWQSSSDGNSWATVATGSQLTLTDTFAGQQLRATVSYIDGENFSEQVFTNTVEVIEPPVDDGDASFLIRGTPEIGNTLTIARTADDPDGNGSSPTITWQRSSDGNSWATVATGSQLTLTDTFAGQQLRATVSYIDGENFSEQVFTNTVEVVSNGDDFPGSVDTDGAVAIDASTTGELEDRADRDWFVVELEAGERYRFDLVGDTLQDPYLYLRGAAGELLTYDDDGGSGLNSQITFQATVNGRYFLDAGAYADSYTGTYTLSATQLAPPDPGGDDFPGSVDTDGAVAIDASTTGELEDRADRDWFVVELEAGERYRFDLVGDTLQDPYLYLRGAAGELLTYDDDGGSGLNSQITFQATVNGRYFLDAGAYADSYTGTYTLSATQLAPPDPGFNSTDGYGHVDAKRAFENLLEISISDEPELGGNLWGLDNVNAPEVWTGGEGFSGVTGENVTIAVIDTGVDSNHSEFNGRMVAGYDFVDDDTTAEDGNGHGTHVAGTIAGANDGSGITGVAYDADIMPIRVLNDSGSGSLADVIAGIRWAADNGADVINLSLGGGGYSQSMFDAVQHASESGAVVVMAAGNSGSSSPGYPAAHAVSYGMAIGAVDQSRAMAGFSNRAGNDTMDYVTAPGVNIYSAIPGGGYARFSGTSMAAPHVAGIAGLLKSHDPNLTAPTIETLLTQSASNVPASTSSNPEQNEPGESISSSSSELKQLITLETLKDFSSSELKEPLIGNLSGNRDTREITFESIDRKVDRDRGNYADLDSFETLDPNENLFTSLDFNNARSIDPKDTLRELLSNKQFDYFEFDQTFTTL